MIKTGWVGRSAAASCAEPARSCRRVCLSSDQTMPTQCAGQPPDERAKHSPVCPAQAWSGVGTAQDGDFVAQHEELDVLG